MGKASSSKKVARAARAAGRPGTGRSYGWPALIGAVVVLGVVLIVISRGNTDTSTPPILGDHWHAAYGIYDCDHFLTPLTDQVEDTTGLHTHGDGLMHMHPFATQYTGKNANIENWSKSVGLELKDDSIKAPGMKRENGDSCGDAGKGTVQLKVWDSPDDTKGHLIKKDFGKYNPQEFTMWVLAFVPEGTDIPPPPQEAIDALKAPSDVPGAQPSTSAAPVDPNASTTVPGATETTAPGTATTAPGDTTPTTTAPSTTASSAP